MKFATRLIDYDVSPKDPHRPMSTPIYQTATFEQLHADSFGEFDYSRSGNPTRKVLEDQLAALENGTRGFCFSSGMAAISAMTHLLKTGDEIVADWDLYGGATRLFTKILSRSGITVRYIDASVPENITANITPATRMLYVESPTNPLLRIIDLASVARIAHQHHLLFCVDNSSMSPYLQNPLDLGADLVLHSATKFLSGHSDVTGGVIIVKDAALAEQIYFLQNAEGTALGPFDCFLILRGLKTLKLRLDAQQRSALSIAQRLSQNPEITAVYYPGLPEHPLYKVHQQQAGGPGAVLSFTVGSFEQAKFIAEKTSLFRIAVSFGSVHSTISIPAKMSHASTPPELKKFSIIPDSLLRLSIGIEDIEDLMDDLAQAIETSR
jgi:cystathionine beta-lyase